MVFRTLRWAMHFCLLIYLRAKSFLSLFFRTTRTYIGVVREYMKGGGGRGGALPWPNTFPKAPLPTERRRSNCARLTIQLETNWIAHWYTGHHPCVEMTWKNTFPWCQTRNGWSRQGEKVKAYQLSGWASYCVNNNSSREGTVDRRKLTNQIE